MQLEISIATRISEIQWKFKRAFPYLKIEFYDHGHAWGEPNIKGYRYDPQFRLGAIISSQSHTTNLKIDPWMKAGEVEQNLESSLGLHAQIYYRQGYSFIETAGTDDLNLDELNDIGRKSLIDERDDIRYARELLL